MSALAPAAFAAALLLAGPAAQANLFINGSFERGAFAPDATGVQYVGISDPAIEGWSAFVGGLYWVGTPNDYGIFANDGRQSLSLYDPRRPLVRVGSVNQTVATTVGETYRLSFDLGTATGYPRNVGIEVFANGERLRFFSAGTGTGMTWETFHWRFTARDTTTAFQLMGVLGAGYPDYGPPGYIGLDNVRLELASAVPEAPAALLLALGLPWVLRRRR